MLLTIAAALFVLAARLIVAAPRGAVSTRRGARFAAAVVTTAVANIGLLIAAGGQTTTELVSLVTAAALVGAIQRWAFVLRARLHERRNRNEGQGAPGTR
jgi:hypothetical protein